MANDTYLKAKESVAEAAVKLLQNDMIVGLGSGTTATLFIQKTGERVKQGLKIKAVASSIESEKLASRLSIPVIAFAKAPHIDITIDGADEVDPARNLIKGLGGALLREKILAYNSRQFVVIVDESKLVTQLSGGPLPVEVIPFGSGFTLEQLRALGADPVIRKYNQKEYITDNGNLVMDCYFNQFDDGFLLHEKIKAIPGVIETGWFSGSKVNKVIIGYENGGLREL